MSPIERSRQRRRLNQRIRELIALRRAVVGIAGAAEPADEPVSHVDQPAA